MWISKKKWNDLEKRVADLEKQIQSQPLVDSNAAKDSLKNTIDYIRSHRATKRDNVPTLS